MVKRVPQEKVDAELVRLMRSWYPHRTVSIEDFYGGGFVVVTTFGSYSGPCATNFSYRTMFHVKLEET